MSGYSWSFDEVFADFDELFNEAFRTVSKLPTRLLSNHFPPCDYYADEDGTLHFEFAVAGYKKEEVNLKFEDEHLILELKPAKAEVKGKVFQRAIKLSEATTKAYVPFSKYDVSKVDASLADGMLRVAIPRKESTKPISVKVDVK